MTVVVFLLTGTACLAQCGSERWEVKMLLDDEAKNIKFTAITSTVHKQLKFTKPDYREIGPRDITELKVYRIDCILVKYKVEDDKDWHLVIQDLNTTEQMVVEIPDPDCDNILNNPHFSKLVISRKRLVAKVGPVKTGYRKPPPNTRLRIIGVGFFDKNNHPIGFKGRELHPILSLVVLE